MAPPGTLRSLAQIDSGQRMNSHLVLFQMYPETFGEPCGAGLGISPRSDELGMDPSCGDSRPLRGTFKLEEGGPLLPTLQSRDANRMFWSWGIVLLS